ncbi:MAG: glutaminyl-peptide cyclotransferase [Smithellaceae bacterium]|jgi:glutamine cyclotransferase
MNWVRIILLLPVFFLYLESALAADKVQEWPHYALHKETKAPISAIKVINIFPHDIDAFTQGLVYYKGYLYESTGLHGKSTLRKVDIKTGKIIKIIKLAHEYFGEGITILGNNIYQLTWLNKTGFVYDLVEFKKVRTFSYQGEGWGITTDGQYLFMSDGSSVISCIDPMTFAVVRKIIVHEGQQQIGSLNELEFIKGEIWANIFREDIIVRISPATGKVLGWVDLSLLYSLIPKNSRIDVLNGIAYDRNRDRIFVTGKLWPNIFEIKVVIKDQK